MALFGKPASTGDFIGNSSAVAQAKEWAAAWEKGRRQPPLLICGPIGAGKTFLAHALAAEMGWGVFEFNASDLRDEETVSRLLSHSSSSGALFGGQKLILVDDADSISGTADRGGAAAISKIIAASRVPTILTARDPYDRKLSSLKAHCALLELRRPHPSSIAALLRKEAEKQGFALAPDALERISQAASGDIRAALLDLAARNTSPARDRQKNIFDTIRAILKSSKYSEARQAAFSSEADHDSLKLWVAQNIPAEYSAPYDIAEAYNALSRADVYDGRIRRAQYYGYLRYSTDMLSSGVALAKAQQYHKYAPYSYPDYIRALGSSKSARALRTSCLRKIASRCHCSIQQASGYLSLISTMLRENREAAAEEFDFDEDEAAFTSGAAKPAAAKAKRKEAKVKKGGD
jgi:replication factor C large subunit